MCFAIVRSTSAIYPVLCDRVEGDQFLFEEEMHETERIEVWRGVNGER